MPFITRFHEFENKLTRVEKGRKYYHLYHEKSTNPVSVRRNQRLDNAFQQEDWDVFRQAEAEALIRRFK